MNIFEQLKDIISDKRNIVSGDCEAEKDFIPFMTQRWLSFYSNSFAELLNNTTNTTWKSFDEKQLWYKFFIGIIPKCRVKKIKYIKKDKTKKTKSKVSNEVIVFLADRFELSRREIQQYLESGTVDLKILKKQIENN